MEEQKKIYIGNLEFTLTEGDLRKVFEEKGLTAKEIKVISDRYTGRAKGFGFAEFDTPEQAQQAIDALNGLEVKGRALRVNKAQKMQPRTERRNGGGGGHFGGGRSSHGNGGSSDRFRR